MLILLLFYRYRNPITTEKFLNPVEESEIEEPLVTTHIFRIILVQRKTMMKIRMRKKIVMKKVSYLLFLLRKDWKL